MTRIPFSFPSDDRLQGLVAEYRRSSPEAKARFLRATAAGDLSEAFALFLALRILDDMPPSAAVQLEFLLPLEEWKAFALALIALGPEQAGLAVNVLLEADENPIASPPPPEGEEGSLGAFRSALALYVVREMGCPLPIATLGVLEAQAPYYRDAYARACIELLLDGERAAPLNPAADTIRAFVAWAFASPMETWLRSNPLSPLGTRYGSYPRPS